jgi:hypothetical protein
MFCPSLATHDQLETVSQQLAKHEKSRLGKSPSATCLRHERENRIVRGLGQGLCFL